MKTARTGQSEAATRLNPCVRMHKMHFFSGTYRADVVAEFLQDLVELVVLLVLLTLVVVLVMAVLLLLTRLGPGACPCALMLLLLSLLLLLLLLLLFPLLLLQPRDAFLFLRLAFALEPFQQQLLLLRSHRTSRLCCPRRPRGRSSAAGPRYQRREPSACFVLFFVFLLVAVPAAAAAAARGATRTRLGLGLARRQRVEPVPRRCR